MARKSRKQSIKTAIDDVRSAVGYIRLYVANKDELYSVEKQKCIIDQWVVEHTLPISHIFILTTHLCCDILILK